MKTKDLIKKIEELQVTMQHDLISLKNDLKSEIGEELMVNLAKIGLITPINTSEKDSPLPPQTEPKNYNKKELIETSTINASNSILPVLTENLKKDLVELIKTELKEIPNQIKNQVTQELKHQIKKELKTQLIWEIKSQLKTEITEMIKENTSKSLKTTPKEKITPNVIKSEKEVIKEQQEYLEMESKNIIEQEEVAKNNLEQQIEKSTHSTVINLSPNTTEKDDIKSKINIGPGLKKILNDKNLSIDKNHLKETFISMLTELDSPNQPEALADLIFTKTNNK